MFKEEYVLVIVEKKFVHCKLFLARVHMGQRVALAAHGETIDIDFPEQHTR